MNCQAGRLAAAPQSRNPIALVLLLVLVLEYAISDYENEDDDEDETVAHRAAIGTDSIQPDGAVNGYA